MKFNINPITVKNIEAIHPIIVQSESDAYFAQLARKILKELSRNKLIVSNFASRLWTISLKSAAYFEDVVSGLGLFAGFRKMHGKMFGKKLPFLTLSNSYLDNEINLEDLQFLIWMIMQESANEYEDIRFLSAENPDIMPLASMIMDILEQEYETAPENETLHYWLHEHTYDDFFQLRDILKWLHYKSYLSLNYPNYAIERSQQELKKYRKNSLTIPQKQFLCYLESNRIFDAVCSPLAVKAVNWWKEVTTSKQIIDILNTIEYKDYSHYKINESGDGILKILPILNDNETLNVDCSSFDKIDGEKDKEAVFVALVKFKDLWQVNGFISLDNSIDDMIKTAKAEKETDEKTKKSVLFSYEKIMEHTGNKQLVFFKTFDEWVDFRKTIFPSVENLNDPYGNKLKDEENFAVFVHPTAGTTALPYDIARMIKTPDNKLYDKEVADEQGIALLCGVIRLPLELLKYLIENKLLPDVKLNSQRGEAHGRKLIQDNMWFIVRFFQPELFNEDS